MERKLRDSWVRWHNLIIKWDELNNGTFSRIQKSLNTSTQIDHFLVPSLGGLDAIPELRETVISKLSLEQSQLDSAISKARVQFLKIAGEMETLTQELTSCEELLLRESSDWSLYSPHPNFPTYTLSHFRLVSEKLLSVYRKELHIKLVILKELPIAKTEDSKLLYLTTWSLEPFLDRELTLTLDLILSTLGVK